MSKELEALKNIDLHCNHYEEYEQDFANIEKSLKALEIIKEKVGIRWNEVLQLWLKSKIISKEEYDLLKEVLK